MAGSTTNLGLTKPTYSEDADIAVINTNMDTLDSKIGAVGSTSLQAQITSANQAISNKTDFMNLSATAYSYDSIEGMTEIYNALPDGYRGVIVANFKDGYHPVCQVTRSTINWGSITAFVDATTAPIFFSVSSGTKTIDKLALNSEIGKYNVETNLSCLNDDYTAIKNLINSMPVGRQIPVKVLADAGTYFMGFVFKNEAGYGDAVLFHHNNAPRIIRLANNVISVKHLSTMEDLANIDTTTFTIASGYTANINSVSKNNKIVTIEGEINFASTTSKSFTAIVTIPSGYRPISNFVVSAIDPINDEIIAGTLLSSTGNLSFYRSYSTATTQIRFSATYITN